MSTKSDEGVAVEIVRRDRLIEIQFYRIVGLLSVSAVTQSDSSSERQIPVVESSIR